MQFLNSPLECFKSFPYIFNWLEISTPLNQQTIASSSIFSIDIINLDLNTYGTSFLNGWNVCFLFVLFGVLALYTHIIKKTDSLTLTILSVIIIQVIVGIFGVQTFNTPMTMLVINNPWQDLTIPALIDNTFIIQQNASNFVIISSIYIKEIIAFGTLCTLCFILADYSYNDTLLIPKTIIEITDEFIYRKNLNLYIDTLHVKQHKEVQKFQEFFFKIHGILLFILIANVQGMIPYSSTITSSLMNTFYVALAVFINIIIMLIKEKGIRYFFGLFLPSGCPFSLIFLLNPIELVSYSFRVISLSVRLFANMMAGHTLMKVIAMFSWKLTLVGDIGILAHYLPFLILFILTGLELAVGFIQTYIFVILIYIYLTDIFFSH